MTGCTPFELSVQPDTEASASTITRVCHSSLVTPWGQGWDEWGGGWVEGCREKRHFDSRVGQQAGVKLCGGSLR